MASPSELQAIPVVDVSGLYTGNAEAVAQELGRAAREVGFLYVAGHGVPDKLFDNVLAAAKRFFALPYEQKMQAYIGRSTNHRGYVPEGEEVFAGGAKDKKEAFDLGQDLPDDPEYLAGNPMLGPNQWPELAGFKEEVQAYYDATWNFGRVLMRGFAMALGEAPELFDHLLKKPPSQLRLIHYPYDTSVEDRPGIGAHTDYECFTLLRSTAPGLEVLNGAGAWIDAPPVPGAYVVNIGDMLEILSNGAFVATTHRVRKVKEERYSFPLFFSLDYYAEVRPLPRFVTRGVPERPGLIVGEHLFAQTAQTFTYLKEQLARGEIALPDGALKLSSFGKSVGR